MDINILVQRLQHGETYTAYNDADEPYTVNRPPTQLNIKAAQVIIAMDSQIKQANNIIFSLQRQLQELSEQHELFKKSVEPSPNS